MSAGKLVGLCFDLRDATHKAHLKTTSYAEHMALDAFYKDIVEHADAIAEGVQGRTGKLITDYGTFKLPPETPILEHLTKARTWIDTNRNDVSDAREIQNDIDSLLSLFNSTIYKLTFLK